MIYTEDEIKIIEKLRKSFTITVAVFTMQHTVNSALGNSIPKSYMHVLHLKALDEINRLFPDLDKMSFYLDLMQKEAERNSK